MITDNQIVELIIDEFGLVDTLIFCEVYSRYNQLWIENEKYLPSQIFLNMEHDYQFFKKQVDDIKKRINRQVSPA